MVQTLLNFADVIFTVAEVLLKNVPWFALINKPQLIIVLKSQQINHFDYFFMVHQFSLLKG